MNTILEQIKSSDRPVTRIIRKTEHFKIFAIGLNKGVVLKKHKAPGRTRLLVLHGTINYIAQDKSLILKKFDEYEIPLGEVHEVMGKEEICFSFNSGVIAVEQSRK